MLLVGIVPLHRHFDADGYAVVVGALADLGFARRVEDFGVEDRLGAVHVLDEALHAAGEGEQFLLAGTLVDQLDADAVVQHGPFAQALGEDFVVELDMAENLIVGQEMHFGAALLGLTNDLQRRHLNAVADFDCAIHRHATAELHEVLLAVPADGQAQELRQRIDAGNADAVQAARHLVGVLVELAAGVQLSQRDFGCRALWLVLVVHLDAGRDAATVIDDGNRVVGVDGDDDVVAVPGQRLVDRVVDDFEDQVVQAGAVGGVTDVHARTLADSLQAFEDLDAGFAVGRLAALRDVLFTHCFGST